MKRLAASLSVFLVMALFAWLCGYDFDQRNFLVGYAFMCSVAGAFLVWIHPCWERE